MIVPHDLAALAESHDILALAAAADEMRRRLHGNRVSFVRVEDVDVEPGAPVGAAAAAGEIRICGAPASLAAARRRVQEVVAASGGSPVSGFALDGLEGLAAAEKIPLRALLEDLSEAGLELIASAPFDRLQNPRRSIEQVNIAGLVLARLTIEERPEADLLAHLRQVGELQRDVGVVRAFAPLPRRAVPGQPTTGYDDVKRVALARLVLEGVPSIQVDWALYGPKLAQVALTMGADDLDAVSPSSDSPDGRRRSPLEEVLRNIRAAGFEPLERNARFEPRA